MGAGGVSAFTFGEARPQDRDQIVAISEITLREHQDRSPDDFLPGAPDGTEETFAAYFLDAPRLDGVPFERLIVARDGDLIAGHVLMSFGFSRVDDHDADLNCHVVDLSIHPDYRRQGLGAKLLSLAQEACADEGATIIRGYVWQGNEASANLFEAAAFGPAARIYRRRLAPPRPLPKALTDRVAGDAKAGSKGFDYLPILFVVVLVLVLARYGLR